MGGIELGPFDLKEPVGRGGTGVVYRGVHRETGLPVAVKVLHPGAMRNGAPPEAFRNEVKAIAALDHPSIIWIVDVGLVDDVAHEQSNHTLTRGHPYLAMEYASGGTLGEWIPPDFDAVFAMLQDLLGALAHGHARSLVHRDLKPGNVLRCTDADVRPGWKLTDFGIATNFERTVERSLPGGIVGTLSYMSPEQITGNWRMFGPWTDLYALGCVVYKVLAGRRPWDTARGAALFAAHLERRPDPLRSKIPVPDGFHEWVAVLMEKRPQDRFQTAAEAALALEHLTQRSDAQAPSPEDEAWGIDRDTEVIALPREGREPSGLPRDWRAHETPPPPPRLMGAGLSVLGLRPPPLVGRVHERNVLWSNLRRTALSGERHLVVLRGHRGVGKTRLARWVGEQAHELAGLPFLIGEARRGEPPEMATARPLRRWLHTERLNPEERLLRIRDTFDDATDEWCQDLSALLGDEPAGELGALGDEMRHVALGQALARLGDPTRPNVLVLDDAQASDDLLRFVLHLMAAPNEGAATLIVVVLQEEALVRESPVAPLVDR
ncbi:MAG: serine/threonine-protein kinase, partial [Myxococcota bacterium]